MGEDVYHILNFVTRITIIVGRNKQDFVQVFQGSGRRKMEDNSTNADPLSYTTNIIISNIAYIITTICAQPTAISVSTNSIIVHSSDIYDPNTSQYANEQRNYSWPNQKMSQQPGCAWNGALGWRYCI